MPPSDLRLAACLVNVASGRQAAVVSRVAAAALQVTGELRAGRQVTLCDAAAARATMERHQLRAAATVLSVFSDEDYDRTVFTVAAPLETLGASVLALCTTACGLVDLSQHGGNHPCLGAVDLVPVHPLTEGTALQDCAQLVRAVGRRLTADVPGSAGFWFGEADPLRRSLPQRRRQVGWYGGRAVLEQVDLGRPDARLGVTGFGAIPYMTNCNVTLNSTDLKLGREIARQIRGATPGGLPGVQAMAFSHCGRVEVACNLDSLPRLGGHHTPPAAVESRVAHLAGQAGVSVVPGSKVIGFTPEGAAEAAWSALRSGDGEAWRSRGGGRM